MQNLRNRVQLIGRLGKDPETTFFDDGKALSKFSIATTEVFNNAQGEKVEETSWHQIVTWGKTAQHAGEYLKKGSEVAIEGKILTKQWQDKEGNNRQTTEIVAHEFLMLGKKTP